MANINNVSSSSYASSIYGSRNILSGLASGLDTETMIENSVAGYKTRIEDLIKQQTKLSWKQDAYRSITDKLIDLTQKYTSYTSQTNLSSNSFFTNSVTTTTGGKYADKISATGKSTSDIQINAVKQLASAARYRVDASGLGKGGAIGGEISFLDESGGLKQVENSAMAGTMTLTWGNKSLDLDFGAQEVIKSTDDLANAIRAKLSEQNITTRDGTVKASSVIDVKVDGDKISFTDSSGEGNSVYISGVSGDMAKNGGLNIVQGKKGEVNKDSGVTVTNAGELWSEQPMTQYLATQSVSVTLDGVTKEIKIGDLTKPGDDTTPPTNEEYTKRLQENLQKGIDQAFGANKIKVGVNEDGSGNFQGGIHFSVDEKSGSSLRVTSKAGELLGLGERGVSNYLDTGKTLGELLDKTKLDALHANETNMLGSGTITRKVDSKGKAVLDAQGQYIYVDQNGDRVKGPNAGSEAEMYHRLDDDGNEMMGFELNINGKKVGVFNEDSSLESILNKINNSDAGVSVSYSKMTDSFTFTAKSTGADNQIAIAEGGLGAALFGATADQDGTLRADLGESYKQGTDAIVSVTVNGEDLTLRRSGNTIDMDGMSVTLKGTFNEASLQEKADGSGWELRELDADGNATAHAISGEQMNADNRVSFTTKADSDKIVDAIKSFVEDYNAVMKEVHSAYATQPAEKNTSKHTRYEPLTQDEMDGMSDKEIERYEEKAKQGILFGDSDLSSLYNGLRNAISAVGDDRKLLESIGISTTYSEGVTTLTLDENQLRKALDNNPDSVRQAFTKSKESGAATNGLIANMKRVSNQYASTSIGNYGILVRKAGTKTKALTLLDNTVQKQIDNLDKQIDKWQSKMSDRIDYYTRQFTALEQLMNSMNSQSSALAGLMGS